MMMFSTRLIDRVIAGATTDVDGIHGLAHWERVWRNGERLADGLESYALDFPALFALFHDTQRLNDDDDPEHGERASKYLARLYEAAVQGDPDLSELAEFPSHLIRAVCYACDIHTTCQPGQEEESLIAQASSLPFPYKMCAKICLDADRLDIWRVSGPVKVGLLFTEEARRIAAIEYINGAPRVSGRQTQNQSPEPLPHIADMTRAQRDGIRGLFRSCADDCHDELELLLRAKPAAGGSVVLNWCGVEVVIDPCGNQSARSPAPALTVRGRNRLTTRFKLPCNRRRLYHYTTWRGLISILASGEIRPQVTPAPRSTCRSSMLPTYDGVWCSFAPDIERALPEMPPLDTCPTNGEALEEYEDVHGLARIEVNPNSAPLSYGEAGGIPPCEMLEGDEIILGGCPDDWRLGKQPIPHREWLSIEHWDPEHGWQAVEQSRNPRVRAIWPLLPQWLRKDPAEGAIEDPDHLHYGPQLNPAQVQRIVERFEAARGHFWFLIARGEFAGALALAVAHSEMSRKLEGLPPIDLAANLCDLAFWHRVHLQDDRADDLTRGAIGMLYPGARADWLGRELQQAGIDQYLANLARESPSLHEVRGAELTIPIALHLLLGHDTGRLAEHADQAADALRGNLQRHPVASVMAYGMKRWLGARRMIARVETSPRECRQFKMPFDLLTSRGAMA